MGRKVKNIHYIYKTTCNVTGKYYVGMHSASELPNSYMGSGKRLRYSIRKYGADNHTKEILSYHDSRELLIEAEKIAITNDMITDKNCMNMKCGGYGGWNESHNEAFKNRFLKDGELRNKFRMIGITNFINAHKAGKIKYNTFEGKTHSDESKKLMSEKRKNTGLGENNSQFGTCWITNGILNKKVYKGDGIPEDWRLGRTNIK